MVRRVALVPAIVLATSFVVTGVQGSPTPFTPSGGIQLERHDTSNLELPSVPSPSANTNVHSEPQVWRVTFPSQSSPSIADPSVLGYPRQPKSPTYEYGARILRAAERLDLDVWKATRQYIDILFEDEGMMAGLLEEVRWERDVPSKGTFLEQDDVEMDISWSPLLTTTDLQAHLSPLSPLSLLDQQSMNLSSLSSPFHTAYHPLSSIPSDEASPSIYGFLQALQARWPEWCEVIILGKSAEGREIKGVKIHVVEEEGPDENEDEDEDAELEQSILSLLASTFQAKIIQPILPTFLHSLLPSFSPYSTSTTSSQTQNHAKHPKHHRHHKNKHPKHPKRPEQPPPVPPNPNPPEGRKGKELFLMGGQHAREWVSPATILYFAHFLLLEAEIDQEVLGLLKEFTFTLVPTINPDGYVYSRDHSRLWKKNRQEVGSKTCKGIDMNSNWGYQWDTDARVSAKSNPCSENYPGENAFQAVETRVVANYLQNTTMNVRAFIDLHSYGQLFMFPYSYSCEDFPKDAETLMEAGLGVAKALKADSGTQYKVGEACDLVYRMAGDAIDWAYGRAGIRFSYSAELRDTGTYGFLLPPHLIRATAAELTSGLVYLAKFIRSNEAAA